MLDLVGNSEDQFSHVAAHIVSSPEPKAHKVSL